MNTLNFPWKHFLEFYQHRRPQTAGFQVDVDTRVPFATPQPFGKAIWLGLLLTNKLNPTETAYVVVNLNRYSTQPVSKTFVDLRGKLSKSQPNLRRGKAALMVAGTITLSVTDRVAVRESSVEEWPCEAKFELRVDAFAMALIAGEPPTGVGQDRLRRAVRREAVDLSAMHPCR